MRPYLKRFLELAWDAIPENSKILEIGPDPQFAVAKELSIKKNAKVYCVTNWPFKNVHIQSDKISYIVADIHEDIFNANTFDCIIAFSFLEHIDRLSNLCEILHRNLKENGTMIMTGGPMWTSAYGHHVWVDSEKSGRNFYFSDKSNPIEEWEHLLSSEVELKNKLLERGISDYDSEQISTMIYHDVRLNRKSPTEVLEIVRNFFEVKSFPYNKYPPPNKEKLNSLIERTKYNEFDFETLGLFLEMRKRTN